MRSLSLESVTQSKLLSLTRAWLASCSATQIIDPNCTELVSVIIQHLRTGETPSSEDTLRIESSLRLYDIAASLYKADAPIKMIAADILDHMRKSSLALIDLINGEEHAFEQGGQYGEYNPLKV
jgi:hypothetical protein